MWEDFPRCTLTADTSQGEVSAMHYGPYEQVLVSFISVDIVWLIFVVYKLCGFQSVMFFVCLFVVIWLHGDLISIKMILTSFKTFVVICKMNGA